MIKVGQVYANKRSNTEYYRVVAVNGNVVNANLYDLATHKYSNQENHLKEKHVDLFLPYFEEAFVPRSEEELAMKLLQRL